MKRVAFLGCGNMGQAIIRGIAGRDEKTEIMVSDPSDTARRAVADVAHSVPASEWFTTRNRPDIVVLAVKPQYLRDACTVFSGTDAETLWVSIAAGVTLESLRDMLPAGARICRVMPNTPSLIGEGMSGFTLSEECGEQERRFAEFILSAMGKYMEVPESMMPAVTGLSGSGPAYVYMVIEALAEGGVAAGLSYPDALKAAVQTVRGASALVEETGEVPAVLKSRVMSAGGATAAAVESLERDGLRAALMGAVKASANRSVELG
ncbi:MAG: pyrroline-5-carboxylate reductase [Fibrobacterota bacterium]